MACLFCEIIEGKRPSTKLHEDDQVVAMRDIFPQAPTHVLIMPREHIEGVTTLTEGHGVLLGRMMAVVNRLAKQEGIDASGFRLIVNCGPDAGQAVPHLHLHLLGGKRLGRLVGG